MKRKFTCVLCVMLCIALMSAALVSCSRDSGPSATPTPSKSAGVTPTPGGNSGEQDGSPLAVADGGSFTLPIVDSIKEFSVWNYLSVANSNLTDLNENLAYIEAEKRTGIHINWVIPSSASIAESLQLSIASNDYEDAYFLPRGYLTQGSDYYIDNDIFMDLEPHIAHYAPNYNYIRTSNGLIKDTLTDSGYAPGFWQIAQTLQWSWMGPLGRTDWLKELNMDIPKTYDELHDVLVAFRDNYNPEIPLSISADGLSSWLMVGFDTKYDLQFQQFFLQIDNVVTNGAILPGFKNYVQMMADWYQEGLVDQEFYSREGGFNAPSNNQAFIFGNRIGIGNSLYTFPDSLANIAAGMDDVDAGFEYNSFYIPVKNEGDTRKIGQGGAEVNLMKDILNAISTQCEDFEILMRWIDYFYTEDGALLASYGIEDVSYTLDENGKPQATEVVYKNPDGLTLNNALYRYAVTPAQAMWYAWEREISPETTQNVWDTKERFDGNWVDEYSISPYATMTAEESSEYSAIMTDINTLIQENIVKFISGQRPMGEFDAFIQQIKGMRLDRATEIRQAAYDRYLDR